MSPEVVALMVVAVFIVCICAAVGPVWRWLLRQRPGPPHPERMVEDDQYTDRLAELLDELWPNEEYLGAYVCANPDWPVYDTPSEAFQAQPGRVVTGCPCGGFHVRPRRRHHPKPSASTRPSDGPQESGSRS